MDEPANENLDYELKVQEMHFDHNGLTVSLTGEPTKLFMAYIIQLFESAHAENFLTFTVENTAHRYAITIQNLNGSDSPAEMIAHLKSKNERLRAILDERGIIYE